ncbi:DNA polymerase-3 subunit delta' [Acetitomaculum ruminis DSM 5522]|uniref:DNA polymerase III subunit delta' n=1 Tax=Acetitomaculum ruminis DSM 5522 TaxID=1120918 RepID=A0A1I0W7A7_9FIRM|nr:DNA polymerase III subunit delta' [Acetitomaculum ruminis]SFA84645.1 DNA polymerase-3 subunit delta' [Acetitomaculum ruminis DSM 5522]
MAGFKDIFGNEKIIESLKYSIKNGKVHQAYIFAGASGMGKKTLAKAFAKTLLCKEGKEDACGECRSCLEVESDNNPDLVFIRHEKTVIGVDDVRQQLNDSINIKPFDNKYKVYIIPQADKLTVQAQNAILKTIEEPPEYAVVILLVENADNMLDTINSRCVTVNLCPLKDEIIRQYLKDNYDLSEEDLAIYTSFAQGNLGKAIKSAESEDFREIKTLAMELVKKISNFEYYEVINLVYYVEKHKVSINDFLDLLMIWYRDLLLFKAVNDANGLILKNEVATISAQAGECSYNGIQTILESIEKAKQRLNANVNLDLTIELLFLTIKEVFRKG